MVRLIVPPAALLRADLAGSPVLVLLTLVLLVVLCVLAGRGGRSRRSSGWAAVLLLPVAAVWAMVNSHLEGPILLRLDTRHGFTTADMLSCLAFLVAGWRLVGSGRRPVRARRRADR